MNKLIVFAALMLIIYFSATLHSKKTERIEKQAQERIQPATVADVNSMSYGQIVYVPVHSKINKTNGSSNLYLNNVLKIRSTSFTDSSYISAIDYYDHDGNIIKKYLSSPVVLSPMATIEIAVNNKEFKGIGDNFIVEWHAENSNQPPIIHALASNINKQIAFSNEAVIIKDKQRDGGDVVEKEF